ncbi:hypothetical protein KTT_59890 [Tengunoibacter tsumagoiensis]|uniref:Virginiamycin B lyase n=1 Tax=Tengunoibacter tsumagoiensis TaxID=2014871 RepID=A0A402AAH0_9CHLR|nr:hypothetical protein KTT_59890 [Tengunoibacter tsumagoiensis]
MLSACDSAGSSGVAATPTPDLGKIQEQTLAPSALNIGSLTSGADRNLWFIESAQLKESKIARINSTGKVDEFALPTTNAALGGSLISGPDGNLWFNEILVDAVSGQLQQAKIGSITSAGEIKEFDLPAGSYAQSLTAGPDNALWFADANKIGRMTLDGQINEFPLSSPEINPLAIVKGSDGNLWFSSIGKIGRLTPTGQETEFSLSSNQGTPAFLTLGGDGKLWFAETVTNKQPVKLGRVDTTGKITEFAIPYTIVTGIASSSDGALWISEQRLSGSNNNPVVTGLIGHLTSNGTFGEIQLSRQTIPSSITRGPNGKIWFSEIALNGKNVNTYLSGNDFSGMLRKVAYFS